MDSLDNTNRFQSENPSILRKLQGASGANVYLMRETGEPFVRKVAFGVFKEKLRFQYSWLKKFENSGFTPNVIQFQDHEDFSQIDMEYLVHTKTAAEILGEDISLLAREKIFSQCIQTLKKIHSKIPSSRHVRLNKLKRFFDVKISENFAICEQNYAAFFKKSNHETLIVNGRSVKNWKELLADFKKRVDIWENLVKDDLVFTHGDPTLSNILVDSRGNTFFIDPNSDDIFSTPSMDFAKLWQSVELEYERMEESGALLELRGNRINYSFQKSKLAQVNRACFLNALNLHSIDCNTKKLDLLLAFHLARIIPYRLRSGDSKVWIYFAEMILKMESALNE